MCSKPLLGITILRLFTHSWQLIVNIFIYKYCSDTVKDQRTEASRPLPTVHIAPPYAFQLSSHLVSRYGVANRI